MSQNTIYQNEGQYKFGPGALYINTSAGFIPAGYSGATGTGTPIGKCGPIEATISATYAEATSIQTGVEMDDAAVSGQRCSMSTTLKQAGIDVLESCVDGFSVERDTDENPVRYGMVNVIGKMKRANAFQLTYVTIEGGIQKWDTPFEIVDYFVTLCMTEETVVTVDAETFRDFAVMFRVLESTTEQDYLNRNAFFLSREEAGV